jgi:Tfp pilus assembly protein PilF
MGVAQAKLVAEQEKQPNSIQDHPTTGDRMAALNRALEAAPDVAANYVLRGELFRQRGQYMLARDDFARALQLAEEQLEAQRWGLVLQATADRARENLRRIQRHM